MSYDLDARVKPCDHYQRLERQVLSSSDFRLLNNAEHPELGLRAPVTSVSSVKLFMNGVEIPKDHPQFAWEIVNQTVLVDEQRQQLRFKQQVRMTMATFEVNYYTSQPFCLKCNGYGKVADFTINGSGALLHVNDHYKLVQRILKFLLTSNCAFYPQFTSRLKEFIGMKFGLTLTEEDITYECMNALENMRNIQISQANVQALTPQEILKSVDSVISSRDTNDPTTVRTKIQVSSYGPDRVAPISLAIRTTQ
jgi:hypothetical protein